MFTGIIEDLGKVIKIERLHLVVETKLNDIKIGDSISVNGVCLTVANLSSPICCLMFDISEETFKRTNLSQLKVGDRVNLERALKFDGRFGGHFVTGHVDTTAELISQITKKHSVIFEFETDLKYIIEKGSVAIDGISLTVASVDGKKSTFTVAVVPHTLKNTNLQFARVGHLFNIEFDIIAKYIEKFTIQQKAKSKITKEFLEDAGII